MMLISRSKLWLLTPLLIIFPHISFNLLILCLFSSQATLKFVFMFIHGRFVKQFCYHEKHTLLHEQQFLHKCRYVSIYQSILLGLHMQSGFTDHLQSSVLVTKFTTRFILYKTFNIFSEPCYIILLLTVITFSLMRPGTILKCS